MSFELEFTQRPKSLSPDLRLYRRLGMLCISLSKCSTGQAASFKQLHFINSLFIDESFRRLFLAFRAKDHPAGLLSPSVDPFLNRCVNYAIGAGLVVQKEAKGGFRIKLAADGKVFVDKLKREKLVEDLFSIAETVGKVPVTEIDNSIGEGR